MCSPFALNSKETCVQIYWNALDLLARPELDAEALVFNLGQTQRCDHVHDLSALRASYQKKMGEDTYTRAISMHALLTDADLRVIRVTTGNYIRWTRQSLIGALPVVSRTKYRIIYQLLG